jgi:hypothetical protein
MSIEQRTRTEVIRALIAVSDALALILDEREVGTPQELGPALTSEHEMNPPPAPKPRAKKDKPLPPVAPEVTQADIEKAEARGEVTKMVDIKPTKPGKTLADLRVALQACITAHGMAAAKERLTPYAKVSDVPDEAIAEVIKALAA